MNVLGLKHPTDNIDELLSEICSRYKKDELSASRLFLRYYREGKFGLFLLDHLEYYVSFKKQKPFHNKAKQIIYSFLLCFLA